MNFITVPLSKMTKLTTPPSQGALLYIVDKDSDFAITFDFLSTSILKKVKIETSGLAKGGINDSSGTGTINVPKANDEQAEGGVNDEVALTPFSGNKLVEAKRPKATKEQVDEGKDDVAYITSLLLQQKLTEGDLIALIASSICPIGVPLPYPSNEAPDGWLACYGQPFDTVVFPELAKKYPTGILPDSSEIYIRGLALGEEALSIKEQSVQPLGFSHNLSATYQKTTQIRSTSPSSTSTGTVTYTVPDDNWSSTTPTGRSTPYTRGVGIRNQSTSAALSGNGTITGTGDQTNPRSIKMLYIVRAA